MNCIYADNKSLNSKCNNNNEKMFPDRMILFLYYSNENFWAESGAIVITIVSQ